MTEQKAIEEFNLLKKIIPHNSPIDIAIKALEKQIPKKMNPNFNCIHCDCGNPIYYQTDRLLHHYNYCCECGQAIKWEDNA